MAMTLWQLNDGTIDQTSLVGPMFLDGEIIDGPRVHSLLVAPIRGVSQAAAAALVPTWLARAVSCNGIPMPAGMFVLRHADRIDFENRTFWVSVAAQAAHAEYVPDQHGQDVFCFITKARLKQDEPITICPGRPEQSCGMIYKRAAWEMALEASTFKCPNCQFDPHQTTWRPPQEKPATTLDDLFRMLSQEPV